MYGIASTCRTFLVDDCLTLKRWSFRGRISSLNTYDNTGHLYNVSRILNPDVATLNKEAYHKYSPLYLSYVILPDQECFSADAGCSTTFVISYGLSFLSITCELVGTVFCASRLWFFPFSNYHTWYVVLMPELETLTNTGAAIIYFWKPIQLQFRRSMREQPDVHAQLMSEYPQGLYHDLLGSLKGQLNAYFFFWI